MYYRVKEQKQQERNQNSVGSYETKKRHTFDRIHLFCAKRHPISNKSYLHHLHWLDHNHTPLDGTCVPTFHQRLARHDAMASNATRQSIRHRNFLFHVRRCTNEEVPWGPCPTEKRQSVQWNKRCETREMLMMIVPQLVSSTEPTIVSGAPRWTENDAASLLPTKESCFELLCLHGCYCEEGFDQQLYFELH